MRYSAIPGKIRGAPAFRAMHEHWKHPAFNTGPAGKAGESKWFYPCALCVESGFMCSPNANVIDPEGHSSNQPAGRADDRRKQGLLEVKAGSYPVLFSFANFVFFVLN